MAILIGIWESIAVLAVSVILTSLVAWWYWRRRLAKLEVKHQSDQGDLVRNFKHQAVNILLQIKTNLHLIEGELDTQHESDKLRQSLKIIEEFEWRLSRLIENMAFISRLETQDHSLSFSEVKPDVIVSDLVSEFQDFAEAKGIELTWWVRPEDFPRITANKDGLRQVFINLIDNAIKYCGDEDEIDIALEANVSKGVIEARVSDTGPGIPGEDLELIFHRGYTVEGARDRKPKTGSQGLGLNIVERVIEVHQGRVKATSELGSGTTFTITLPIKRT